MKFISKTEAYSYILAQLTLIKKAVVNDESLSQRLSRCIKQTQVALANHTQDFGFLSENLSSLFEHLDREHKKPMRTILRALRNCTYDQTPQERFENPLTRRLESEFATTLLLHPTNEMMAAVGELSQQLLGFLSKYSALKDWICPQFADESLLTNLGAFKSCPQLEDIQSILQENNPKQLPEIMFIHYVLSRGITRFFPITNSPIRMPVGKLAEIARKFYPENPTDFFREGLAQTAHNCRRYISDNLMYHGELYTAFENRGRARGFDTERLTNQLGLMLWGQDETNLPTHDSEWIADCKNQPPNLDSPYVMDLIDNDAVYVAGPSGMASMLLNQMEILGNFEDENIKKNYLSAIVAYIVGGGFHSIHEVIGPAEYCLSLVPGYRISVPQENICAAPPNYQQFFAQQCEIDPEFYDRCLQSQHNYIAHFLEHYPFRADLPPPVVFEVPKPLYEPEDTSSYFQALKQETTKIVKKYIQGNLNLSDLQKHTFTNQISKAHNREELLLNTRLLYTRIKQTEDKMSQDPLLRGLSEKIDELESIIENPEDASKEFQELKHDVCSRVKNYIDANLSLDGVQTFRISNQILHAPNIKELMMTTSAVRARISQKEHISKEGPSQSQLSLTFDALDEMLEKYNSASDAPSFNP